MELIKITSMEQIPKAYRDTPIGDLIGYHNLGREFAVYDSGRLLVGMCMDNRKQLRIPRNFAYVIRAAGANLRGCEFPISYAVSVGGVTHMALIAHDQCGMAGLDARREAFVEGMVSNAGWDRVRAEVHFRENAPRYEIGDEAEFIVGETKRLGALYPGVTAAAMLYTVGDQLLSLIV